MEIVMNLGQAQKRNSYKLVVCLSEGLLYEKLKERQIPVFLFLMGSKGDIFRSLLKFPRLIRWEHVEIVHTLTVSSNLVGRLAAVITGRPCVTHLHSLILRDFADLKRGRFNERIEALTRPFASRYIAVSHSLREEMIDRGMREQKILTIHNAIDPDSLDARAALPGNLREEFHLPAEAFLIVLVALLRPRKGVDVLIRAMRPVVDAFPDTCLLIVGSDDISEEPDYGEKLRTLAHDLGLEKNVIFTGFRDNVPRLLKGCNLMAQPSRFGEGLPMVILEAMALGLPVVASVVEGIPEVIEEGITGFLVPPDEEKALVEKIIAIRRNPALLREIAIRGAARVRQNLDGFSQARKVADVYEEVLKE